MELTNNSAYFVAVVDRKSIKLSTCLERTKIKALGRRAWPSGKALDL